MRDTGAHGAIRKDFPGGWPGDSFSGFDAMNPYQVMYEFIQSLSSVRAEYAQLFIRGKRTHYIPKNGVYAFFIEGEKDVLGIFANQSNPQFTPNFKLYPDIEADWDSGKVIVSNENAGQPEKGLTPNGIMVLHFRKK
jgi:glycosidase